MSFNVEESDFSRVLVQFIAACSDARACWYSLKMVSNDIPSLPEVMGLTYESAMYMFQCCGLASRRSADDEWNFLPQKFATFINLYGLEKKTDIIASKVMIPDGADGKKKRKRCWFIRLGANDLSNVRFAGYPVTAPRINGIESSRSTFQDTLWKLGTKYKKVEAQLDYTMFQKFLDAAAIQTRRLSHVMIKEEEMNCLNHDPGLVVSDGSTFYPAVEKGGSFSSPPPLCLLL